MANETPTTTTDRMVRSFPDEAHARALVASAARRLTIGTYLARLVDLHERAIRRAKGDPGLARDLDDLGLSEVRT